MKRIIAGALLALVSIAQPTRNVRLREPQFLGDSLKWQVQWTAPARSSPRSSDPTGYEVELWWSPNSVIVVDGSSNTDSIIASSFTTANISPLRVELTHYFECADSSFFRARVRAVGIWDGTTFGEWGYSDVRRLSLTCPNPAPGAPGVTIDTMSIEPDSARFETLSSNIHNSMRPPIGWPKNSLIDSIGIKWTTCAYTYRNEVKRLASPNSYWVDIWGDSAVLQVDARNDMAGACWDITAIGEGSAQYALCWSGCDCCLDTGD